MNSAMEHTYEERPWGQYTVLLSKPGYQVKELIVNPGGTLSLQKHEHRDEHWTVVQGEATITKDEMTQALALRESIDIPRGAIHRIANKTDKPLMIIEVQYGEYLEEDDITRFDDIYGRSVHTAA
jgi:mannose-6-phosphate isomerase-like protein (cupin superfamily)